MGTAGTRQALREEARRKASGKTWSHVLDDAARAYVALLARRRSGNATPVKE